jgi:ABC-type sugar transport system ATPase subunit/ribose/xylose/arabinose/galactoside ABC-type transport system permease subunit
LPTNILSIRNITKVFSNIKALDDVSFDVKRGEILGLLGANGAGKSTLLKILGGIQAADCGEILINDQPCSPKNPYEAACSGIASVYQELNLFSNMTVAENLFIGHENTRAGFIDWNKTYTQADEMLLSMGLNDINSRSLVQSISIANRQLIEIARAISQKPQVLLLDEPTASLSGDEIKWLFSKIRELTNNGTTVIYVSHILDEVVDLCDRCVILRDGKLAATLEGSEINRDEIVLHMVGKQITANRKAVENCKGEILFSCQNLSLNDVYQDISFSVKCGEIVGIAGLVGAGRTELLNSIFGVNPPSSGSMQINNRTVKIKDTKDAINEGVALVSEDRKLEGLFLPESGQVNLAAMTLDRRQSFGFIEKRKESQETKAIGKSVMFDLKRMSSPVRLLSGGNQQKVVIGRTLLTDSRVILLDEPTRGVDVGARNEIYSIIQESANEGKAIILVSSDWEELVTFSDRILVISQGEMVGELEGDDVTEEKILQLCTIFKIQEKKEKKEKKPFTQLLDRINTNPNTWVLGLLLIALFVVGSTVTPFFLNKANLNNIVWQTTALFLLTIGQLIVIITGGIDLSISATMTVASVIGLKLMLLFPDKIYLGVLVLIAVGLAVGIINGLIVVFGKIDAFVATLGVQIILQGIALIVTPKPLSPTPVIFRFISNKTFLNLPIVLYIGVSFFFIFLIFFKNVRLGRYLFAVGDSYTGALWSGLKAKKVKFLAYMMASMMAVVASFYMLGRNGAAEPIVDSNLALNSIAYSLIGGGILAGGKGSLFGSVLAAFVISFMLNILNHIGLNAFWQGIIRGVVILTILVIYESRVKQKQE